MDQVLTLHSSVAQPLSVQLVAVVVAHQVATVLTVVPVVVQDTHQHQAELVTLVATHHLKETTVVALALLQVITQQAVAVVLRQPVLLETAQAVAVTVEQVQMLIHLGLQQHRQDKMSAAHIGTPVVAVVEYSAVAA